MAKKTDEVNNEKQHQKLSPDKEVLLMYDESTGAINMVSDIDVKKGRPTTVTPLAENSHSFFEAKESSVLANFLSASRQGWMETQNKNKSLPRDQHQKHQSEVTHYFRIPESMMPEMVEAVNKVHKKVDDPDSRNLMNKYRISEKQLNRIKFDMKDIPWPELATMGITKAEVMGDKPTLDGMREGREIVLNRSMNLSPSNNMNIDIPASSLQLAQNRDGDVAVKLRAALPVAEFLTQEFEEKHSLSNDEKKAMIAGETLQRQLKEYIPELQREEWCYAGFSKETNRMVLVPRCDVTVPQYLMGGFVAPENSEVLSKAGRTEIQNCKLNDQERTPFTGTFQYNVHTQNWDTVERKFQSVYIYPSLARQLDEGRLKDLKEGLTIPGNGLKGSNGKDYDHLCIKINNRTNTPDYMLKSRMSAHDIASVESRYPGSFDKTVKINIADKPAEEQNNNKTQDIVQIPQENNNQKSQGPRR
ncbi:MAG: DUF4099 domain-containing protein [Alistipes sp.]|nr:DUF4099 domain-containing protein [Alistipes sp.]